MTMPNFLVIGAAKCGTNALCSYLAQHPQIYFNAHQETMFFCAEGQPTIPYCGPGDRKTLRDWDFWVHTRDRYQTLFRNASTEPAIGEGSTWYIYDEQAPERIRQHIPHAKLIAVLRNPVERAYSAFTMLLRDGREPIGDFATALAQEDKRVGAKWEPLWHYRRMGFYYAQLKRYYDTFDAAQIRVVLYDDFNARPDEVMRDLYTFLEVDPAFVADTSARLNVSLVPKNLAYHRLLAGENPVTAVVRAVAPIGFRRRIKNRLITPNLVKPPPMPPEVRSRLVDVFRQDIMQLQDLLGRDLSQWLRC
jgi:hypothetical protein